jgi:phasin
MAAGPRKTKTSEAAAEPVVQTIESVPTPEAVTHAVTEQVAAVEETVEKAVPAQVAEVIAEVKKVQEAAKHVAEETVATLEGSFEHAAKNLQAFSAKAFEAYQNNATASVNYAQALAGVRSVSEAIALISEHTRQQYEALVSQSKELTALAQQLAVDSAGPLKDQVNKIFKAK